MTCARGREMLLEKARIKAEFVRQSVANKTARASRLGNGSRVLPGQSVTCARTVHMRVAGRAR